MTKLDHSDVFRQFAWLLAGQLAASRGTRRPRPTRIVAR